MGRKVDISEVIEFSDDLKSASEDIKSSLDKAKENIDQINAMSSFSGKAAKEAKGYFNDLHKTILKSFNGLFTDLDDNLKKHLDTFEANVDSNKSAIIQSDYLNDTEGDISDYYEDLKEKYESVKETINSVADISSATAPSFYSVNKSKNEAHKVVTDLDEELGSFTSEGDVSQTKDLLHNIEVTMNKAGAVTGEARFTDYRGNSTVVGLPALKGYNKNNQQEREQQIENLDSDSKEVLEKAEEDYESGNIDWSTLEAIKSGVIATGAQFVKNAASSKVTNKVSEEIAGSIVHWAQRNSEHFINRGLVAAPVNGNNTLFTEAPSKLSQTIRTGARYAPPVIGSAIDFGVQISQGEDATDAAIKTGGHLAAGAIGAKVGTIAGGPIGTAVGFGIGVAGSMLFDVVYDNRERISESLSNFGSSIAEGADKVGEAVSGFFGNLGSAFG